MPSPTMLADVLSFAKRVGYTVSVETKKVTGLSYPGREPIFLVKDQIGDADIVIVLHPDILPSRLQRMLIDPADTKKLYNSNFKGFPKELRRGKTETAFGLRCAITSEMAIGAALAAYVVL